jgi:hypothetical protein
VVTAMQAWLWKAILGHDCLLMEEGSRMLMSNEYHIPDLVQGNRPST